MEKEILELNDIARKDGAKYRKRRFIYDTIADSLDRKAFIGIIGPRGVGKTVLLRQILSSTSKCFYISLDSTLLTRPLFEIAKELQNSGIKHLLLDEVHFLANPGMEIKKIYDFLDIRVIFTGSVSIFMHRVMQDLSRRIKFFNIYPFSFDEFLFFRENKKINTISFEDLLDVQKAREFYGTVLNYEYLFDDYLKGALFPFTLQDSDDISFFQNILNTMIRKDLIGTSEIELEEISNVVKMIKFIALSQVEGISYSSISKNTGITKYMAEKYVHLLERSFLLNVVMPKGTNVTKEPKILMNLPYRLLHKSFDDCVGAIREDFFVMTAKAAGYNINYLKSGRGEKVPDYYFDDEDIILEIGGIGKSLNQFKNFPSKRKLILTHPGSIDEAHRPLFMFGMLSRK